jgi:site-specific recombinase XerD
MIEDMTARKLGSYSQRSHIHSCRRFAAFLKRSPDTATADDVRGFQLYLVESGLGISNRNRIMTGVKFLFRVTLRRHDLAAEIYHLKEPEKLPLTMSPNEAERLLTMAGSLRDHVMLSLGYGCGLRAGHGFAISCTVSGCHADKRHYQSARRPLHHRPAIFDCQVPALVIAVARKPSRNVLRRLANSIRCQDSQQWVLAAVRVP